MIGQTIGHYKILEELGRGGMGIVYKAHDTTLERDVALKFLPPHLSASAQDKARFLQEAKAAATLDHPNICTIYSIEEHERPASSEAPENKQIFIAMQFVDGQLLRDKLSGLSRKQAIDIGVQVAEGLAAAHEKGIVHRDIKPENIMVRKDGIVQIMDFGLAKLKGVSRLTKEGSTVGTAGYMSPEQIQGQDADHRSDIFSLGVLLYEMLTGQLPFRGVHETAIAYEIVNVDAHPMSTLKSDIDPELDRIVLECLEKDPAERSQSVKQVAVDLKRIRRSSSRQTKSGVIPVENTLRHPDGSRKRDHTNPWIVRIPWIVAGCLVTLIPFLLLDILSSSETSGPPVRSSVTLPESLYVHSFGFGLGPPHLAPDGSAIAFVGIGTDGRQRVYIRRIGEQHALPLNGTEDGTEPFWEPGGKMIGFFTGGRMKKVDLAGGSPTTIAAVPNPRGATWAPDGTILFAPDFQSGLFRVSSSGSEKPSQVTSLDSTRHEGSHRWPVFLPDGKHFLYLARSISETGNAEGDAVYVGSLDDDMKKPLLQSSFNAAYADGYLLFARGSSLMAQPFDPSSLELEGDPTVLQEGVLTDISYNVAVFSASQTGMLIFQEGSSEAGARPMFVDRNGKIIRYIDDRSEQDHPRFSPDGRLLAIYVYDTRSRLSNIWTYDLQTARRRRLTSRQEGDFFPVWSANGQNIYYSSGARSRRDIYVQAVGRTGEPSVIYSSTYEDAASDCSPDGSTILIESFSDETDNGDLLLLRTGGGSEKAIPFQATRFNETEGRISPDGRWVSFTSNESGEDEIYVKEISTPGAEAMRISSAGGSEATWSPDGKEIFYLLDGRMMVAALKVTGPKVEVLHVKPMFSLPPFVLSYDVSPDGKQFVFTRGLEMQRFPSLSLVMNWKSMLARR